MPGSSETLAIDEATYGPDHPKIATSLGNLALLLLEVGEPGTARPLLERALAIDEAAYGPEPSEDRHQPGQPSLAVAGGG